MYKSILLTESEITLLRKVIHTYLHDNLMQTEHNDIKNLHIIDRILLGTIPTKTNNQETIRG